MRRDGSIRRLSFALGIGAALLGLGSVYDHLRDRPWRPAPFALEKSDGSPFRSADLSGRPALVFFGYTFCPDVCPMTLSNLVRARRIAGKRSIPIYFVTVDWQRDDSKALLQYEQAFGENVIALRGDRAATDRATDAFGVAARPTTNGLFVHTDSVFYIRADGRVAATLRGSTQVALLAAQMKEFS